MTAAPSHHRLHVQADLGALRLDTRLEFAAPWTVIFGPSGSGKSSLLRAMCGLLHATHLEFAGCPPDPAGGRGRSAAIDPAAVNRADTERVDIDRADTDQADIDREPLAGVDIDGPGHHTPAHLRRIAYAPQGAVLFPHLTVRENVAFSLNSRRREVNAQPTQFALGFDGIDEALKLFALSALAGRRPRDLSGGERQRVNLARAFAVPAPQLMLLDEPFTGIDRATRATLLPTMREQLAASGIPVISVTHDVEEALLLNAEIVRLEAGRVLAQGPARQVLAAEREHMLRVLQSPGPAAVQQ